MSRNADFPGVGLNPDGCLRLCVVEAGLVTLSNETLDFVVVRVGAERRNVVVSKSIRLDRFSWRKQTEKNVMWSISKCILNH